VALPADWETTLDENTSTERVALNAETQRE
jgi:hypothetical protein